MKQGTSTASTGILLSTVDGCLMVVLAYFASFARKKVVCFCQHCDWSREASICLTQVRLDLRYRYTFFESAVVMKYTCTTVYSTQAIHDCFVKSVITL